MNIMSDGYIPLISEWNRYHNFRPSLFQRIVWYFWPTEVMQKWGRYRYLKEKECYNDLPDLSFNPLDFLPRPPVGGTGESGYGLMLNMIAIRVLWSHHISWNTPLYLLCHSQFDELECYHGTALLEFNPRHAYLVGAENDLRRNAIILYLAHPEFPVTPEGCSCLEFSCREAEARFPWLFHDTDPLLYRRY